MLKNIYHPNLLGSRLLLIIMLIIIIITVKALQMRNATTTVEIDDSSL